MKTTAYDVCLKKTLHAQIAMTQLLVRKLKSGNCTVACCVSHARFSEKLRLARTF